MNYSDNEVELVGYYGSDETHALSAWTSTSRNLTEKKRARMGKLIHMLAQEGHHTPFEKSMLHFLVKTDIATHIHLLKHRIGVSINGESARYKELKGDNVYIPYDWDDEEVSIYTDHIEEAYKKYHECLVRLEEKGISRKRAKEVARFYLPYSNQIVSDISFNFRSFMHFQKLRNSEHAQDEVKNVAEKMLQLIKDTGKFTESLRGFGYNV